MSSKCHTDNTQPKVKHSQACKSVVGERLPTAVDHRCAEEVALGSHRGLPLPAKHPPDNVPLVGTERGHKPRVLHIHIGRVDRSLLRRLRRSDSCVELVDILSRELLPYRVPWVSNAKKMLNHVLRFRVDAVARHISWVMQRGNSERGKEHVQRDAEGFHLSNDAQENTPMSMRMVKVVRNCVRSCTVNSKSKEDVFRNRGSSWASQPLVGVPVDNLAPCLFFAAANVHPRVAQALTEGTTTVIKPMIQGKPDLTKTEKILVILALVGRNPHNDEFVLRQEVFQFQLHGCQSFRLSFGLLRRARDSIFRLVVDQ